MKRLTLFFCAGLSLAQLGCRQDSLEALASQVTPAPADTLVSFAGDLMPLVEAYCSSSGCHDGSNALAVALTSYAELRPQADSVVAEVEARTMPIGTTLTPAEIQVFTDWLEQGALNN